MQIGSTLRQIVGLSRCHPWLLSAAAVLLAGCPRNEPAATPPATPRASVPLTVLVVNDRELAESIQRLRGEWKERGGGPLEVVHKPWRSVAEADPIDADLIIFPARYLGSLVTTDRLRPMRDGVLRGERYDADDVLPLARHRLAAFAGRTMALPLGVQMPLVGFRRTADDAKSGGGPQDWRELRERAAGKDAMHSVFFWPPPADYEDSAAIMFLARAAPYATHPRQESVLFDPVTMKPRIAAPPFVRALEEWREEKSATIEEAPARATRDDGTVQWAELPASAQVFNRSSGEWEPANAGLSRVPLLAGGTLLAVTASSRNAAGAFALAEWLASAEVGRQLGPIGRHSLPVRRSLLDTSGRWLAAAGGRADSSQVAAVVQTALSRRDALVVPRIPGVDRYLAALSEAVEAALRGDVTPSDALTQAAAQWDAITDQLGRDAQRRAYLADLGTDVP